MTAKAQSGNYNAQQPNVAVLGAGAWGKNHVRCWAGLGHLHTVCDARAEMLERAKQAHPEIQTTTSVADVLSNRAIDAVVIATPAATHAELAERALRAGKDVLVEKPMALNTAEGRQLVETAQALGRILMVGHVLVFHPVVHKLEQLIATGELGRVRYIYSNRLNLGRIRTEENALWSFAPHDIAIIQRLLKASPEEVACHGDGYLTKGVADTTLTTLRFGNGVRAHIFVSWLHPFKEHRFVVVGERQMAVFEDTRPVGEKLVLYPHRVDWVDGQVPVANKAEGVAVDVPAGEPLKAECQHFIESIRSRQAPHTDGKSALAVLEVLEAAQTSLEKSGSPVTLGAVPTRWQAHPTATVDKGAEIGDRARIWHYSHVMSSSVIGPDCILGQNVFVGPRTRLGRGVKVQNNVSVYEGVTLEDQVFCGPSMVFTNVINPRSEIERKDEFRPTLVRQGATLGANSTILCGSTIGRYAMVGAGAVVTKDVANHAVVVGVPASVTGFVCRCGHGLGIETASTATCKACGTAYVADGAGGLTERAAPS